MVNRVFVIGVGMTKFEKPETKNWDFPDMAKESVSKALADARIGYEAIEQAYAGSAYGSFGQRALYDVGLTGVPIMTVINACATGSSALFLARQAIRAGCDATLAVGYEKMRRAR